MYEWTRRNLRRIEIMGPEDTAKKPEIPDCNTITARLRKATDEAHARGRKILNIIKRNNRNG